MRRGLIALAVMTATLAGTGIAHAATPDTRAFFAPLRALNHWFPAGDVPAAPIFGSCRKYGTEWTNCVVPFQGRVVLNLSRISELEVTEGLPSGSWVMYDLEATPGSAFDETTHPRAALQRFTRIAHARGWRVVFAPGASLVYRGTWCKTSGRLTKFQNYIRCGLARYAHDIGVDRYIVMGERIENDTRAYTAYVLGIAEQFHRPWAQLSVQASLNGWTPTAWKLAKDWAAVRDRCGGLVLWGMDQRSSIPMEDQERIGIRFFELMKQASGGLFGRS